MRLTRHVVIAAVVFGCALILWAFAAITEYGAVSGESSDPSQTARIVVAVPAWVRTAKLVGLAGMLGALVGAVPWRRFLR